MMGYTTHPDYSSFHSLKKKKIIVHCAQADVHCHCHFQNFLFIHLQLTNQGFELFQL